MKNIPYPFSRKRYELMHKSLTLAAIILACAAAGQAQSVRAGDEARLLRSPDIHGDRVALVYVKRLELTRNPVMVINRGQMMVFPVPVVSHYCRPLLPLRHHSRLPECEEVMHHFLAKLRRPYSSQILHTLSAFPLSAGR